MTDSYGAGSIHYYRPRYGSRDDDTVIRYNIELDDSPAEQETQTEEELTASLFAAETAALAQDPNRQARWDDMANIQPMVDTIDFTTTGTTATATATATANETLRTAVGDWNANFWSSPISFTHPTGDPIIPKPKPITNPKQVTRRILNFSEEGWVVQ